MRGYAHEQSKRSDLCQADNKTDWLYSSFWMARLTTGATVSPDMRLPLVMMVRVTRAVALFLGLAGRAFHDALQASSFSLASAQVRPIGQNVQTLDISCQCLPSLFLLRIACHARERPPPTKAGCSTCSPRNPFMARRAAVPISCRSRGRPSRDCAGRCWPSRAIRLR